MHVGGFQVGKIVIVHGEQIMIRTLAVEEQAILLGNFGFTKSQSQQTAASVISRA
jgi:hypothetical protein